MNIVIGQGKNRHSLRQHPAIMYKVKHFQ